MCTPDTLLSSIVTVSLRTSHQKNLESRENINDKINHVYQILILFSALHTYSVSFNAENNTLRRGPAHPLSYRGGNRLSDVNEVAQDRSEWGLDMHNPTTGKLKERADKSSELRHYSVAFLSY